MRAAVLVNRAAGTTGKLTPEQVEEAFRDAGIEATVELVEGDRMAGRARAALRDGADAVVAGGGDGTINCVAGVLAGTGTPLGVLPLGTLNHFAGHLAIPADLGEAARVIAAGHRISIDLGEVNGNIFVNNSVLGFYPPIVQERDRQRRRRGLNKWVAAGIAAARLLPRLPALRLTFEVDGRTLHRTTRFVFVGNTEYELSLFAQTERDRLDTGELYVYIVRGASRLTLVRLALLALVSDARRAGPVESWSTVSLSIEERHPRQRKIPVFLDGEVLRLDPPLRYRALPRALTVLAPERRPERAG